jgi:hypothetical protein
VRASALAGLLAVSIGGGSADPGLLFFVSLAVVAACGRQLRGDHGATNARVLSYPAHARALTGIRGKRAVAFCNVRKVASRIRAVGLHQTP